MRSRSSRAVIGLLIPFAVVASACGNNNDDAAPTPSSTSSSTTTESTTTSTVAPGPPGPLTGLPVADEATAKRPALILKIDNSDGGNCNGTARPQVGLNLADIVIEELVEGITRFMAVFQSNIPETVGPIRSARSSDLDLLTAFKKPMFGWSGNNTTVGAELFRIKNSFVNVGYDSTWSSRYFRETKGRCAPHNLFVSPNQLYEAAGDAETPERPFAFRASGQGLPAGMGLPTTGVSLKMGYPVEFNLNTITKQWERTQKGSPHLDADGKVMAVDNVVVLMTTYKMSSTPGSLQAISVGKGRAMVYTDGKVVEGEWTRPFPESPWSITTGDDAKPVELTPGRSWVYLGSKGSTQDMTNPIAG
ncbi:MAG TPA: DUF3048 domain-containing protein [Acidimicrobiales bacterium]|nr:DUF3048 domain-containing protein [Acidimicrobiales bacterium]